MRWFSGVATKRCITKNLMKTVIHSAPGHLTRSLTSGNQAFQLDGGDRIDFVQVIKDTNQQPFLTPSNFKLQVYPRRFVPPSAPVGSRWMSFDQDYIFCAVVEGFFYPRCEWKEAFELWLMKKQVFNVHERNDTFHNSIWILFETRCRQSFWPYLMHLHSVLVSLTSLYVLKLACVTA